MPFALGPDDYIWIAVDRDRVVVRIELDDHFCIGEIREAELAIRAERLGAEIGPEVQHAFVNVPVNPAEPLLARKLDSGAHNAECQPGLPVFGTNRQSLEFAKVAKEPCTNAGRRLLPNIRDQMG